MVITWFLHRNVLKSLESYWIRKNKAHHRWNGVANQAFNLLQTRMFVFFFFVSTPFKIKDLRRNVVTSQPKFEFLKCYHFMKFVCPNTKCPTWCVFKRNILHVNSCVYTSKTIGTCAVSVTHLDRRNKKPLSNFGWLHLDIKIW